MKMIVGSIVAATAASVCCMGPVVAAVIGAGALGAASTQLEPYRPWFLGATVILLGAAFATTYRRERTACADGSCAPSSRRTARTLLWIAVVVVALLAAFPYYVGWLL
jgi:mercuric ion transport protein